MTTVQLHSTKPELRFCAGSNPARGVSEIRDGEDLWQWSRLEIRLNPFRRSTIPQKQFIIIIISLILIFILQPKTPLRQTLKTYSYIFQVLLFFSDIHYLSFRLYFYYPNYHYYLSQLILPLYLNFLEFLCV